METYSAIITWAVSTVLFIASTVVNIFVSMKLSKLEARLKEETNDKIDEVKKEMIDYIDKVKRDMKEEWQREIDYRLPRRSNH